MRIKKSWIKLIRLSSNSTNQLSEILYIETDPQNIYLSTFSSSQLSHCHQPPLSTCPVARLERSLQTIIRTRTPMFAWNGIFLISKRAGVFLISNSSAMNFETLRNFDHHKYKAPVTFLMSRSPKVNLARSLSSPRS